MSWKAIARFPIDIRRARNLLKQKVAHRSELTQPELTERPIVLLLRATDLMIDSGRHLATIAHHCIEAGSPLFLCCGPMTLAAIAHKPYGRQMLTMPGVQYVSDAIRLPLDSLILTDRPNNDMRDSSRAIRLCIGRTIDRCMPVMPYPMHPSTLTHRDGKKMKPLREQNRRFSILFAGNAKPSYDNDRIGKAFGVLNRRQVLDQVRASAAGRIVDRIDAAVHRDSIVLSDSRVHPIETADWLPSIASADFFLCCPGSSQPTCHHLTEAMAVGTIPIIQYGDRLTPELTDGVNAICFSEHRGLADALGRIGRMSAREIATMHSAAAKFFDTHLCGTRFITQLRDGRLGASIEQICLPFHDQDFWEPRWSETKAA